MGLTPVMWTRISPLATFDTDGMQRLVMGRWQIVNRFL